jgi:hypothetical protein
MSNPSKEILNELKKVPIEDKDINKISPETKVITYADLKDYNDINELLPNNNDSVIILYEQQENSGHWVAIKKLDDCIYYFNSYGGEIDAPLKWSKDNNDMLGQGTPYLKILLQKTPLNVYHNSYQYQSDDPNITSCGLWCMSFIKSGLTLQQFYSWIQSLKKKYKLSNDDLITKIMVDSVINK